MKASNTFLVSMGCLLVCPAYAESQFDAGKMAWSDQPFHQSFQDPAPSIDEILLSARQEELRASYQLSTRGEKSIFGYIGSSGEAALGPPVSFMRRYAGLDVFEKAAGGHWLYPENTGSNAFTVGYAWRDLTVERSVFSSGKQERAPKTSLFRPDSRSVRLSYKPSSSWTVQLSRGSVSGLDQLMPNGDVRRTTVSATYQVTLPESHWQTTLAWGRNARKSRETVMGYLLESTYRFNGMNVVFGRLEQVGSDELMRQNESVRVGLFKMNKLTVGYFRDLGETSRVKFDVGILASRHFVPTEMSGPYGSKPVAYMAFIRLKPQ